MSRLDYGDFHDHANDGFNSTLDGLSVKGVKFQDFGAAVDASLKKKVTGTLDINQFKKQYFVSASVKAVSTGDIKPSITYEKGDNKYVVNVNDRTLKYQYNKVPAVGGAITTKVLDGLCSDMWMSTIFDNVYQAGFSASYDPSRSGLKKLSYGVRAQNPDWFKKGTVSFSVDGPKAYSLGVSYKAGSNLLLSALCEKATQSFGFKWTAADGTSVTLYSNTKGGCPIPKTVEVGTTINKKINGTKVTVGALINPSTLEKKAGIKIGF